MTVNVEQEQHELLRQVRKIKCEADLLYFTRYFYKVRYGSKFILNFHHYMIVEFLTNLVNGKFENGIINVPPGSSKTETAVVSFMPWAIANNNLTRFLHLSYSDDLAMTNSAAAKEILESKEFHELWNLKTAVDSKAKKRWNVVVGDKSAGGVYAAALGGQITGFRAGRMEEGFNGMIIIDDPLKPEDGYSRVSRNKANRRLVSTVKSRKAKPETPILVIMQRLAQSDCTDFILSGNLPGQWEKLIVPAIIDDEWVKNNVPAKYHKYIDSSVRSKDGRFSYWERKERLSELLQMEQGGFEDKEGERISRHVFAGQYMQNPVALGGNIVKGEYLKVISVIPKLKARYIFADTAQKTKERHDYSVFACVGETFDNKIIVLDVLRGKWESPDLKKRAKAFWYKHKGINSEDLGLLRKMYVEDKSSGTDLIQTIKYEAKIPIEPIQRTTDKLTRMMDGLPYYEMGSVQLLEGAWVNDFISEHEAFNADMTHDHDDQIDPTLDAIEVILSKKNKTKMWSQML